MNTPEEELFHFTITGIAPKKKTVKIPPGLRTGWILSPFKATGHLKVASTGEVLDLYKTPEDHGMRPGKANRVDLEFVAAAASSRGSSQTPRSRPSTPGAASGGRDPSSTDREAEASKPRSIAFADQSNAAAVQGVAVGTPTPNASKPVSTKPTPTAGTTATTSGNRTPASATPTAGTPKMAGASAMAAARQEAAAQKQQQQQQQQQQPQARPLSPNNLQQQASFGALTKMASASFAQEESNTFTVVGGVATLQRPKNSAGLPEPKPAAVSQEESHLHKLDKTEEVVQVPQGDSLSRVSSTLNTPRTGSTPGGGSKSPGRIVGASATPKASSSPMKQQHQQHQSTPQKDLSAQRQVNPNVSNAASDSPGQVGGYAASSGTSRSRGLPPTTGKSPSNNSSSNSAVVPLEAPLDQQPHIVAYVQLPDGRREPVYYKEGAAKPVFLVNAAATGGGGGGDSANADGSVQGGEGQTYLISTPRSTTGAADRNGGTPTNNSNDNQQQQSSGGRFGATPKQQQQQQQQTTSVAATNRFSSPAQQQQMQAALQHQSDPGRNSFFGQEMNTVGDSALNPMSQSEINEQVNELRSILFTEQQRREELEGRLTHLFGVADSWATLRHSLTTAHAGSSMMNDSRAESAYYASGANETPRSSLFAAPAPPSSFQRLNHEEAAVLAEHERQLEELKRQRMILSASIQQERRPATKSPSPAMM